MESMFTKCLLLIVIFVSVSYGQITYDIVSDFGATCNGAGDDDPAFLSFNTAAKTWQSTHVGQLITLNIPVLLI